MAGSAEYNGRNGRRPVDFEETKEKKDEPVKETESRSVIFPGRSGAFFPKRVTGKKAPAGKDAKESARRRPSKRSAPREAGRARRKRIGRIFRNGGILKQESQGGPERIAGVRTNEQNQ